MERGNRRWTLVLAAAAVLAGCAGGTAPRAGVGGPAGRATLDVRFVTDEADAALALLAAEAGGAGAVELDAAWAAVAATEGYRRLKAREAAMGRGFDDASFRAFLARDTMVAREPALRRTLAEWTGRGVEAAAARAFRYLPAGSLIRAKVYPVIKPKSNSFVFEPATDPAIFLYLDPAVSGAALETTVAHELHHIGVASICGDAADTVQAGAARGAEGGVPPGVAAALDWMGGFAEGLAVLAAAGDAATHPHAASDAGERAVWDRDVARVPEDMARLEAFFLDLMDGRLDEAEAGERGFAFVVSEGVPQGPFYTVGWHMAATIERELGRARVVADACRADALVRDYEEAAERHRARTGEALPRWSRSFLDRLPER